MNITRRELLAIINEQVFGIRQMSQSPVLGTLGINSPSERKKINACKQAVTIINNSGGVSKNLFKILDVIVSITGAYYHAEIENKDINAKFRNFSRNRMPHGGHFGGQEGDQYTRWLTTKGKTLNPSPGSKGRPRVGSFGMHMPEEFFDLIDLLQ